jgi:hypothetical protein
MINNITFAYLCKIFKKYTLNALFITLFALESFSQVDANSVTYFEDFNSPGAPTDIPADSYWMYYNEIHPTQDTWNKFIPGDGNAYITVDPDISNDTDWIHPYQALIFGGVGENHRLEVRMKGAVVDGGLVSFLFTYHQEGATFNEVDLELVANDSATPSHETLPENGGWTDARFNTWKNADENTERPFTGTKKAVVNQSDEKISLIDDQFHTYTIDWRSYQLDFFIDGVLQETINTNVATGWSEVIIGFRDLPWAGDFNWSGTHTLVVDYLKIEPLGPLTVAIDDSFALNVDVATDLDVLANDGGENITITSFDALSLQGFPVTGTPSLLTYTSSGDFIGLDTITYTIEDSEGTESTAIVNLIVGPAIPFPTAKPDAVAVSAGQMTVIDVLADNGSGKDRFGTDGAINGGLTMPNGTLTSGTIKGSLISIDNKGTLSTLDDVFNFIPSALAEAEGTDKFSYVITDASGDASTGEVTVTISTGPVIGYATDTAVVDQDSIDNEIDVMANDTDDASFTANEERFLIDSVDHLTGTTEYGGTVTLNTKGTADTSDDVINYTPLLGFIGVDTFNYIPGNYRNELVLVTITVGEEVVATGTLNAVTDSIIVAKNSSDTPIDVTDNDDYGANGENLSHPLNLSNGKMSTETNNGGTIIVLGGKINYSAPTGFTGIDTFTYTITDGKGFADTAIVTVTVGAIATVALNDSFLINVDTATELDVLANDVTGATILSTDAYSTEGYPVSTTPSLITYTPSQGFIGTDTFNYVIEDANGVQSTATVGLTVTSVSQVPVPTASNDTASVNVDSVDNIINVLSNDDFGIDGAIDGGLTMTNGTLSSASVNDGLISIDNKGTVDTADDVFKYSPKAGFTGTDTFLYTITDASGDASTAEVTVIVSVRVGAINDALTVDEDSLDNLIDVLANDNIDAGAVGTMLFISPLNAAATTNQGGTITCHNNGGGSNDKILYTPLAGFSGIDTFQYTLKVGLDEFTGNVTVTVGQEVTPPNPDAATPTAVNDAVSVDFESVDNIIDVTANDSFGSDGQNQTHPLTLTNGKLVTASTNGGLISVGDNNTPNDLTDDVIIYTSPAGFNGVDTFEYTITDATGDASKAIVTVAINLAKEVSSSINLKNEFTVYPNPSNGYVKSTLFSKINTKATLVLFDITGKVVYNTIINIEKGNNEFDFNLRVKPGILFMKIISAEVNYGTSKIMFK